MNLSAISNSSSIYSLHAAKEQHLRSFSGRPFEVCKRVLGIALVLFASLLILPIPIFAITGTYRYVKKWIFELKRGQIVDSNIVNKMQNLPPANLPPANLPKLPDIAKTIVNPNPLLSHNKIEPLHPERWKANPYLPQVLREVVANRHNLATGYRSWVISVLLYSKLQGLFLDNYGVALANADVAGKICYTFCFDLMGTGVEGVKFNKYCLGSLCQMLVKEKAAHPTNRPAKILIPCALFSTGLPGHVVLLVVEPDALNVQKANVTMVNTHGDSLSMYKDVEEMILDLAKQIYPDPQTKVTRNEKATYTGGYCGIDAVENAYLLATTPDVQAYIANRELPSRSPKVIADVRLQHAPIIEKFIQDHLV